jgi:hypothetical protein
MTIAEIGDRMSGNELMLWLKYDEVVGIPDPNDLHARLCYTIAIAMSGSKKLKVEDFQVRPPIKPPVRKQTTQEIARHFDSIFAATAAPKNGAPVEGL